MRRSFLVVLAFAALLALAGVKAQEGKKQHDTKHKVGDSLRMFSYSVPFHRLLERLTRSLRSRTCEVNE